MILLLLAATLAAAGGITALITTAGLDRKVESLSTTLAELQKDLRAAQAKVRKLSEEKAELNSSLDSVNKHIRQLKGRFDTMSVEIRRLDTVH
jgi:chromosome segregation ATPase